MFFKRLIQCCIDTVFLLRPTLLIPIWTVFLLGWIGGAPHSAFNPSSPGGGAPLILILSFTALGGYIFILNQIADIEGDRKNGKLFILPDGHLSRGYALFIAITLLSLSLLAPLLLLDIWAFVIVLISALLGYAYSLYPFYLKDRPWGGAWANFFGHGFLTYYAGWYSVASIDGFESFLGGVPGAISAGFANGAVYLNSTVPDAEGDESVGKRTFAVAYGIKRTAFCAAIWVTLSLLFSLFIPYNSWVMISVALLSTPLFWNFYKVSDPKKSFATFRWPVLLLSLIVSIFVPIYLIAFIFVVAISRIYYWRRFGLCYPSVRRSE